MITVTQNSLLKTVLFNLNSRNTAQQEIRQAMLPRRTAPVSGGQEAIAPSKPSQQTRLSSIQEGCSPGKAGLAGPPWVGRDTMSQLIVLGVCRGALL